MSKQHSVQRPFYNCLHKPGRFYKSICQLKSHTFYTVYSSKQSHMIYVNAVFSSAFIVHLERRDKEDEKRGTELFQLRVLDCVAHAFLSNTIMREQGNCC